MILLHQPKPVWGLPNMSPFCAKLETYLRMAKIEYKAVAPDMRRAPKGKIPYITDGDRVMGDSGLIIEYLKEKYGDPLDRNLSEKDRSFALSVRRMLEEHTYFAVAWLRWYNDASFAYVAEAFQSFLPPIIGGTILKFIRRNLLQTIRRQGIGRHSPEEIVALANSDLAAVSTLLADKPYLLGPEPSSIDAVLYGFAIQVLWVPWDCPVKRFAKSLPNLESYCERMNKRYWS